MNWNDFTNFIVSEIPTSKFVTGTCSVAMYGTGSTISYFLRIENGNRVFDIRYCDDEINNYPNEDVFYGWVSIKALEKYTSKYLKRQQLKRLFIVRPDHHDGDKSFTIPRSSALRIKEAIVEKVREKYAD